MPPFPVHPLSPPCTMRRIASAVLALTAAALVPAYAQPAGEPVELEAARIDARTDVDAVASGDVRLRRGPLTIRADRLSYTVATDVARASGAVEIRANGDVYRGRELELQLERYEGYFLEPDYFISRAQAGGRAERIDFIDRQHARIVDGDYTSCARDGTGTPDWLLSARRVDLDFENNEGRAEGAVLRFLGVPILAAPVLTFPLTSARKSGWLPPDLKLDSRSGLTVGVPYYWNIAPPYDATLVPTVYAKRGAGLGGEFRYLDAAYRGIVRAHVLPEDRVAGRTRSALALQHEGVLDGWRYRADLQQVSDDDYWKDFDRDGARFTPRLLPRELEVHRRFGVFGREWTAYAGLQHWQVLQGDPLAVIVAPYQRSPQLGVRGRGRFDSGVEYGLETEYNRFDRPPGSDDTLPTGQRVHLLGSLAWPLRASYGALVPRLALNAAAYDTDEPMADGRRQAARAIPTLSVDGTLLFERRTRWLGLDLRQTLEPRILYAHTPRRDQSALPNFDAAPKDFNEVSIYSDNAFSGIDRVSDAHQVTAGVSTRFIDVATGVEKLRFALVQRYLFRDQRISAEGPPLTQRFSDVLLSASSTLSRQWTLDASAQYSPSLGSTTRSIVGARYSPGPFRAVGVRYRLARDLSEQVEAGWQWPLFGPVEGERRDAGACKTSAYSVGRLNYSLRDQRLTDSLLGVELDSGCWIARIVAERTSTGRTEAVSRVMLQLELVGLSRLGSNPLSTLKDNIPGYRLLREPDTTPPPPRSYD
ncbi:LPS-assembly protein LptD [Azohydromonas sediminis]|uniref:LPS-assembly protein LptD n=1 Tax=Azohydromonas sediminis TaxID=2259674 RepID=UPI001F192811|nr:LPS assembly protein LptD [Azohydromonas sediminis]